MTIGMVPGLVKGGMPTLRSFYQGTTVLVTGHTGFKGAWLTAWLSRLGAKVSGLALPPEPPTPSLYIDAEIADRCRSHMVDLRDSNAVLRIVTECRPRIIFHLGARALVQQGYEDPIATFATNIMGTAHILEAARLTPSVESVVCVTTDKVYRNREWSWPYRESDEFGGLDAYGASKAGAEMIARAYNHGLCPKDRPFGLVTMRGGNVLGGGDFSPYRLIPDTVRALMANAPLHLRNPNALRPWQHVLDLCHGYLWTGHMLAAGKLAKTEAFNLGPAPTADWTVRRVVDRFVSLWGADDHRISYAKDDRYEATTLAVDSAKARQILGWSPLLSTEQTLSWSAHWYRGYGEDPSRASALMEADIATFESLADGNSVS